MPPVTGNSPKYRSTLISLIVVAAIAVVAYGYFGAERTGGGPAVRAALPPGPPSGIAPSFRLRTIDGATVSLSDFKGHVVILDFWASWCAPCKREIPDFINLQNRYHDAGLRIVGVALDDEEPVRRFARQTGINYPIALADGEIAERYGGVEAIPTTFIINRDGTIDTSFVGYREMEDFEKVITQLL